MSAGARGPLTVLDQGTPDFDEALASLPERGMTQLEAVEAVLVEAGAQRHSARCAAVVVVALPPVVSNRPVPAPSPVE